jgi:multidrug efflux pump subunit AcrA (membrane-fusion protein)
MKNDLVRELSSGTEFRLTLMARPPRLVHATAILMALFLGAGLLWAALTEADLVVSAPGLVRPAYATRPVKTRFGGRVVAVYLREGQEVNKGDLLIRLDTDRLDNDIQKRELTIRAAQEEYAKGELLLEALTRQLRADHAAIAAKLELALEEVAHAKERRDLDIRLAEEDLRLALHEVEREKGLLEKRAGTAGRLDELQTRLRKARHELTKARIPVEEGKVEALRRERAQAEQTYLAKRREVQMKLAAKRGEIKATRKDLDTLKWERAEAFVRAPMSGVVTTGDLKEGEILEAGKVVAEIAVQQGFRFEVRVPSEDVGPLRAGMQARVRLDPYDYQKYGTAQGTVCFISPDSKKDAQGGGVFYTVRIELAGDEVGRGEYRGRIKLGMAGKVEIVTERESLLTLLLKKLRHRISLG